jgi:gliding motility-associated-like protein
MRILKNIFLIIIGCWTFPTLSFGQCKGLSAPQILQAPDSLCAEKKDLILKTGRAKEAGAKYLWRTPWKDTITTDSVLVIKNPTAVHSGNYSVAYLSDTCQSKLLGPIVVQIMGQSHAVSDTVKTKIVCNASETELTSIYKTNKNVSGQWFGTEGVIFDSPNAPTTKVRGLKDGESVVVWMLSTSVCPFFASDTFRVRHEIAPKLETDGKKLRVDESSTIIPLGQISGSNLNIIKEVDITISKKPEHGTLDKMPDGKRLKYSRNSTFQGRDVFDLQVCNLRCPNLCSSTITYSIEVGYDERYPNVTLPKLLSPKNTGDGRLFKVENIEEYPENALKILNRWGNTLVEFKNYKNTTAWDGVKDGTLLPSGAYYYFFTAKDPKGKTLKPLASIFYIVH